MISQNTHISSHSLTLTPRQKRSIPLVLRARSIDEGCRAAKISPQTWYRWMKVEGFSDTVRTQREAIIAESLDRLKSCVTDAVNELTGLVRTGEGPVRLRACHHVLTHFMKVRELEDMERRLAVLEETILGNDRRMP